MAKRVQVDVIVDALKSLGGEAHLSEIYKRVNDLSEHNVPSSTVRGRIEEHSSDSTRFQERRDLFYSVYGVGKGWWGLRSFVPSLEKPDSFEDEAETIIEKEEGRIKVHVHLHRERSKKLVSAFKNQLEHLRCSICEFDFETKYGKLGAGFVEAHHTIPIAKLVPGAKTKISDLIAVCSNCHRMLHRNGLMDWRALKAKLQEEK